MNIQKIRLVSGPVVRSSYILVFLLLLFQAPAARAAEDGEVNSAEVVREVLRGVALNRQQVNFWWLPTEFWVAAAKEHKLTPEEVEEVRRVFSDYVVLAAVEARVDVAGQPSLSPIAELVRRMKITRNGVPAQVLHQVNPRMQELAPRLTYAFQASLSMLGQGLRLLPLANLDAKGEPILLATGPGTLKVEFSPGVGKKAVEFTWRGPLTSIKGPQTCPHAGEELEANWEFCPWHGVPLTGEGTADSR